MKTTQDIIVLLAQTEVLVPLEVLWKICGMCPSFEGLSQPKNIHRLAENPCSTL